MDNIQKLDETMSSCNLNICSIAKNGSMKYLVTKRFIRNPGLLLSAIGLPIKLIKRDTIWWSYCYKHIYISSQFIVIYTILSLPSKCRWNVHRTITYFAPLAVPPDNLLFKLGFSFAVALKFDILIFHMFGLDAIVKFDLIYFTPS